MESFGNKLPGFVQQDFTVESEPFFSVKIHLLLEFSLGSTHNPRAGAIAAMVDVDVIGIQIEIGESFLTKNISLFHDWDYIFIAIWGRVQQVTKI